MLEESFRRPPILSVKSPLASVLSVFPHETGGASNAPAGCRAGGGAYNAADADGDVTDTRDHMTAQIIDGKQIAERMRQQIAERVKGLARPPLLAAVIATDDAGAVMYAQSQQKKCEQLGIGYRLVTLPGSATQAQLQAAIEELNADDAVDGIIIQQPLPKGIDEVAAASAVRPDKDVEGVSPTSLGLLAYNQPRLIPCTALAAWEAICAAGVAVAGAEAVIIGRSRIVGRPLSLILVNHHATVTVCHTRTRDLAATARRADILVVAAGRPGLVTGDFVKPGATVIDVGTNRVSVTDASGKQMSKTVGDVDFVSAAEVAGRITPVPGGVGPITVTLLLRNTLEAAEAHLAR
ncbi:MAG: Bifunctional protein FolD protein [Phycisphaerae bacterium]|nr:Bifunctional protein FolD protein [Phycisphaerae bacterium]